MTKETLVTISFIFLTIISFSTIKNVSSIPTNSSSDPTPLLMYDSGFPQQINLNCIKKVNNDIEISENLYYKIVDHGIDDNFKNIIDSLKQEPNDDDIWIIECVNQNNTYYYLAKLGTDYDKLQETLNKCETCTISQHKPKVFKEKYDKEINKNQYLFDTNNMFHNKLTENIYNNNSLVPTNTASNAPTQKHEIEEISKPLHLDNVNNFCSLPTQIDENDNLFDNEDENSAHNITNLDEIDKNDQYNTLLDKKKNKKKDSNYDTLTGKWDEGQTYYELVIPEETTKFENTTYNIYLQHELPLNIYTNSLHDTEKYFDIYGKVISTSIENEGKHVDTENSPVDIEKLANVENVGANLICESNAFQNFIPNDDKVDILLKNDLITLECADKEPMLVVECSVDPINKDPNLVYAKNSHFISNKNDDNKVFQKDFTKTVNLEENQFKLYQEVCDVKPSKLNLQQKARDHNINEFDTQQLIKDEKETEFSLDEIHIKLESNEFNSSQELVNLEEKPSFQVKTDGESNLNKVEGQSNHSFDVTVETLPLEECIQQTEAIVLPNTKYFFENISLINKVFEPDCNIYKNKTEGRIETPTIICQKPVNVIAELDKTKKHFTNQILYEAIPLELQSQSFNLKGKSTNKPFSKPQYSLQNLVKYPLKLESNKINSKLDHKIYISDIDVTVGEQYKNKLKYRSKFSRPQYSNYYYEFTIPPTSSINTKGYTEISPKENFLTTFPIESDNEITSEKIKTTKSSKDTVFKIPYFDVTLKDRDISSCNEIKYYKNFIPLIDWDEYLMDSKNTKKVNFGTAPLRVENVKSVKEMPYEDILRNLNRLNSKLRPNIYIADSNYKIPDLYHRNFLNIPVGDNSFNRHLKEKLKLIEIVPVNEAIDEIETSTNNIRDDLELMKPEILPNFKTNGFPGDIDPAVSVTLENIPVTKKSKIKYPILSNNEESVLKVNTYDLNKETGLPDLSNTQYYDVPLKCIKDSTKQSLPLQTPMFDVTIPINPHEIQHNESYINDHNILTINNTKFDIPIKPYVEMELNNNEVYNFDTGQIILGFTTSKVEPIFEEVTSDIVSEGKEKFTQLKTDKDSFQTRILEEPKIFHNFSTNALTVPVQIKNLTSSFPNFHSIPQITSSLEFTNVDYPPSVKSNSFNLPTQIMNNEKYLNLNERYPLKYTQYIHSNAYKNLKLKNDCPKILPKAIKSWYCPHLNENNLPQETTPISVAKYNNKMQNISPNISKNTNFPIINSKQSCFFNNNEDKIVYNSLNKFKIPNIALKQVNSLPIHQDLGLNNPYFNLFPIKHRKFSVQTPKTNIDNFQTNVYAYNTQTKLQYPEFCKDKHYPVKFDITKTNLPKLIASNENIYRSTLPSKSVIDLKTYVVVKNNNIKTPTNSYYKYVRPSFKADMKSHKDKNKIIPGPGIEETSLHNNDYNNPTDDNLFKFSSYSTIVNNNPEFKVNNISTFKIKFGECNRDNYIPIQPHIIDTHTKTDNFMHYKYGTKSEGPPETHVIKTKSSPLLSFPKYYTGDISNNNLLMKPLKTFSRNIPYSSMLPTNVSCVALSSMNFSKSSPHIIKAKTSEPPISRIYIPNYHNFCDKTIPRKVTPAPLPSLTYTSILTSPSTDAKDTISTNSIPKLICPSSTTLTSPLLMINNMNKLQFDINSAPIPQGHEIFETTKATPLTSSSSPSLKTAQTLLTLKVPTKVQNDPYLKNITPFTNVHESMGKQTLSVPAQARVLPITSQNYFSNVLKPSDTSTLFPSFSKDILTSKDPDSSSLIHPPASVIPTLQYVVSPPCALSDIALKLPTGAITLSKKPTLNNVPNSTKRANEHWAYPQTLVSIPNLSKDFLPRTILSLRKPKYRNLICVNELTPPITTPVLSLSDRDFRSNNYKMKGLVPISDYKIITPNISKPILHYSSMISPTPADRKIIQLPILTKANIFEPASNDLKPHSKPLHQKSITWSPITYPKRALKNLVTKPIKTSPSSSPNPIYLNRNILDPIISSSHKFAPSHSKQESFITYTLDKSLSSNQLLNNTETDFFDPKSIGQLRRLRHNGSIPSLSSQPILLDILNFTSNNINNTVTPEILNPNKIPETLLEKWSFDPLLTPALSILQYSKPSPAITHSIELPPSAKTNSEPITSSLITPLTSSALFIPSSNTISNSITSVSTSPSKLIANSNLSWSDKDLDKLKLEISMPSDNRYSNNYFSPSYYPLNTISSTFPLPNYSGINFTDKVNYKQPLSTNLRISNLPISTTTTQLMSTTQPPDYFPEVSMVNFESSPFLPSRLNTKFVLPKVSIPPQLTSNDNMPIDTLTQQLIPLNIKPTIIPAAAITEPLSTANYLDYLPHDRTDTKFRIPSLQNTVPSSSSLTFSNEYSSPTLSIDSLITPVSAPSLPVSTISVLPSTYKYKPKLQQFVTKEITQIPTITPTNFEHIPLQTKLSAISLNSPHLFAFRPTNIFNLNHKLSSKLQPPVYTIPSTFNKEYIPSTDNTGTKPYASTLDQKLTLENTKTSPEPLTVILNSIPENQNSNITKKYLLQPLQIFKTVPAASTSSKTYPSINCCSQYLKALTPSHLSNLSISTEPAIYSLSTNIPDNALNPIFSPSTDHLPANSQIPGYNQICNLPTDTSPSISTTQTDFDTPKFSYSTIIPIPPQLASIEASPSTIQERTYLNIRNPRKPSIIGSDIATLEKSSKPLANYEIQSNSITLQMYPLLETLKSSFSDYFKSQSPKLRNLNKFESKTFPLGLAICNEPSSNNDFIVKTKNPNIAFKGWYSNMRFIKAKIVFEEENCGVYNFIPVIHGPSIYNTQEIQNLAKNLLRNNYGEAAIVKNINFNTTPWLLDIDFNRLGNSKYYILWPIYCKTCNNFNCRC